MDKYRIPVKNLQSQLCPLEITAQNFYLLFVRPRWLNLGDILAPDRIWFDLYKTKLFELFNKTKIPSLNDRPTYVIENFLLFQFWKCKCYEKENLGECTVNIDAWIFYQIFLENIDKRILAKGSDTRFLCDNHREFNF